MSIKIFISYRRRDSIATAGRIHDRMAKEFGRNNIFMDVDGIPAGVDFIEHLNMKVEQCDVLLAIIGPSWLDTCDAAGHSKIGQSNDFVATEIAAALVRNIQVIPVLVDGAIMPLAEELPESLRPLARRNAVEVRNTQFHVDAGRLIEKMREGGKPLRAHIKFRRVLEFSFGGIFILGLAALSYSVLGQSRWNQSHSWQLPSGFSSADFKVSEKDAPPVCEDNISALPEPVPVTSGGLPNLALLKQTRVQASSVIPGFQRRHQVRFLADGWYNNCRSWIPAKMPAWVEIDLGEIFELSSIKLGSEHTKFWEDRAPTAFSVSTKADEKSNWNFAFEQEAAHDSIRETKEFRFTNSPRAQYVRIDITATRDGDLPRLDEVEIYGRRN